MTYLMTVAQQIVYNESCNVEIIPKTKKQNKKQTEKNNTCSMLMSAVIVVDESRLT